MSMFDVEMWVSLSLRTVNVVRCAKDDKLNYVINSPLLLPQLTRTGTMVVQAQAAPQVNGIDEHSSKKVNGKPIKSKNQLRRLKLKQKKASTVRALGHFKRRPR